MLNIGGFKDVVESNISISTFLQYPPVSSTVVLWCRLQLHVVVALSDNKKS